MKPQTINQEILLFTHTSFAKRELCEWDDEVRNEPKRSVLDKLENACWSGLLFEMFPDEFNKTNRRNMCVWKVNQAGQFIHIELGSTSASPECITSIDPYFFLQLSIYYN